MAHQSKFVSVNLNRSYGQPSQSSSSSAFGHGRARPGSGGGMVVLSRPRSSSAAGPKTTQKLSVPAPLNLPSLRKEHERFDPSSSGAASGHGSSGLGSGSGSSTMGWTKPAPFPEKEAGGGGPVGLSQLGNRSAPTGDQRAGSPYMPPGARSAGQPLPTSPAPAFSEKAVILRGEDFPSLRATFVSAQKQKEAAIQKQKQRQGSEEPLEGLAERPELRAPLEMRPQIRSSRLVSNAASGVDGGLSRPPGERSQKQGGYSPGPLPLVRLKDTSDWADDERDTGLSIPERDRDRGFSRLDTAQIHDIYDGPVPRDLEIGGAPSREFLAGASSARDIGKDSRDVGSWRVPVQPRERTGTRDVGADRDKGNARPYGVSREMCRESNNLQLSYGDNARDGFSNDSRYPRRDLGSGISSQNGTKATEAFSGRVSEQNVRGRYGDHPNNWHRGNSFQSSAISKAPFSSGSKGFSLNDPILNFGREKRSAANSGKPYAEDADFEGRDPFLGGIGDVNAKVFKRRKDTLKQADFRDPVRESFEAELESILQMQEKERQRAMEEQARALELARKEEEERERLAREEEERRRLLEEEAREAAWRAEQERLEASRRAEEQRVAREEEKRRILMEEERRKEAARQKLLELEARMARRQAESTTKYDRLPSAAAADERVPGPIMERDVPKVADVGDWEDGERLVERITSSASSDSSNMNRIFDSGSRPHSSRDGNSPFTDRGKRAYSWNNGNSLSLPFQDQEHGYRSPRRDTFASRRGFPKKDFHGGTGVMSVRPSSRGGTVDPTQMLDDFRHVRELRWSIGRDGDPFNRNSAIDAEFLDNDKFGDVGWGPSNSHGSPRAPYAERLYQNSEVDGFSSFARPRHSLRQPHVPPPPTLPSTGRSPYTVDTEHSCSSSFMDGGLQYHHTSRNEQQILQTEHDSAYQETVRQPGMMALGEDAVTHSQQKGKTSPRCDSQSSLSVSSPPSSPTHLSHDEMDVSGDSPALPTSADGEQTFVSDNEHTVPELEANNMNTMTTSSPVISRGEDDEWAIESNREMQEQEEYDEEDDGYQEVDESHEVDENLDLGREFEELQSDMQNTTGEMEPVILGFDEGVEVKISINNEFEVTSGNNEKALTAQTDSVLGVEELSSSGEKALPEETLNSSSKIINETEKAMQSLALDPVTSTRLPADSIETSSGSGMSTTVTPSSSLQMPSTSGVPPILSAGSTVASQGEAPVKLQFGLFSGPSLIPSVPAIQIGSIQMPIHLHTQASPSLTQMHPSQPPLFQFGQLRYTPPISQSVLPLAPQTLSFVQPPPPYSLNQNILNHATQEPSSQNNTRDGMPSGSGDKQPGQPPKPFDSSQVNLKSQQQNTLSSASRENIMASLSLPDMSASGERSTAGDSASQAEPYCNCDVSSKKNDRRIVSKESQAQVHSEQQSSQFIPGGKAVLGSKAPGIISVSRGKRLAYAVKNAGSKLAYSGAEYSQTDSRGFQRRPRRNIRRTEFRVRENVDMKQTQSTETFNHARQDEKPNFNARVSGISARNVVKKEAVLNKSTKMTIEPNSLNPGTSSSQFVSSDGKADKVIGREAASKSEASAKSTTAVVKSHGAKANYKTDVSLEEDVDAPLHSGVVRVYKQPGIETPSDEDDFIEVRSKRQVLNDRREQREKENKSKTRVPKMPRKQRAIAQSNAAGSVSIKAAPSLGLDAANSVRTVPVVVNGRGFSSMEPSIAFTASMMSQALAPIGTPPPNAGSDARSSDLKSSKTASIPPISTGGAKLLPGLLFENKSVALENSSSPLGSWDDTHINEQVMALTQTQLEEAMKPAQFDSHAASSVALELNKSITSVMTQEKPFSSSSSNINSLLAGERIQFGAVTSPTILPPVSRAVSNGLGPPGSRLDVNNDHNLPTSNNDCSMFFGKEKHPDEACTNLEDPEAEAEAAASAVAVAAISNDEMVGSGVGACSVSTSDVKSFNSSDVTGLTSGVARGRKATGQSSGEESLTVALPADLSVDTPSLSLWPPLPSPQPSGPMLSHFPGAPPSHFPCFEVNPMLGGRIFAFGPHDESAGTQGQSQRSTAMGSGPLGAWPPCPSGVDSFYGPPAGFTGPFISPGGIPGVQGHPHMVVYNHFPVGQFGQVGLSFMGTTYIPTGKQPDWKHNPVSSASGDSESDLSNLNVVSGQRTSPTMPAPIQHLGSGSPLMQMASPLTMFDITPFQSSADIPIQARWSHLPAPPLHSVPLSLPLQQHLVEGGMPSQFNHSMPVDSSGNTRFHEPRSSVTGDGSRTIPVTSSTAPQFPDELGLVGQPTSSSANAQPFRPSYGPSISNNNDVSHSIKHSTSTVGNATENGGIVAKSTGSGSQSIGPSPHPQQPTTSSQQYLRPIGYADQRGGNSQKMGSGGDWHRRTGFHGRNQGPGPDKNFASSKMKQIYVAKPSTGQPAKQG